MVRMCCASNVCKDPKCFQKVLLYLSIVGLWKRKCWFKKLCFSDSASLCHKRFPFSLEVVVAEMLPKSSFTEQEDLVLIRWRGLQPPPLSDVILWRFLTLSFLPHFYLKLEARGSPGPLRASASVYQGRSLTVSPRSKPTRQLITASAARMFRKHQRHGNVVLVQPVETIVCVQQLGRQFTV